MPFINSNVKYIKVTGEACQEMPSAMKIHIVTSKHLNEHTVWIAALFVVVIKPHMGVSITTFRYSKKL